MASQRSEVSRSSSRKGHNHCRPVPWDEAERRLRPVLDLLYGSDNHRQALKLALQAEKKRPGWPAARALRAIALRRMGKKKEAFELAENVLNDLEQGLTPADEDAAAKLHLFYREVPNHEQWSARAYEAVARKNENDFSLSESSFFFHVHARDFGTAQKIATRMQRASSARPPSLLDTARPKGHYATWAAIALWLDTRESLENAKLARLTSAMLERALGDVLVPSADLARLATRIFCELGDFERAKEVLSNQALVMDDSEKSHLKAEIAFQSQAEVEAREMYQEMIMTGDVENWDDWLRLINLSPSQDVLAFLKTFSQSSETTSKTMKRAQMLAEMEVYSRQRDTLSLESSVQSYFEYFGNRSVCANDLRSYALAVATDRDGTCSQERAEELCFSLERACDFSVEADSCKIDPQRRINIAWIRLWLGCLWDAPEQLFSNYQLYVVDSLQSTERQPGDDLIILAAHRLLPDSHPNRYKNIAAVASAILVVEAGLTKSPHNYHFKLLLIRLYVVIGAVSEGYRIWKTLDVKHVQLATLGHLVLRPLFELGVFSQFDELSTRFMSFWAESERDVPDSVSLAFSKESFNAAVEFIEFQDRLHHAHTMTDSLLCTAMRHLCVDVDGTTAFESAWTVAGDSSRLSVKNMLRPGSLYKSADDSCMEFWDLYLPDASTYRTEEDALRTRNRETMSENVRLHLIVTTLILRVFLRVLHPEDCSISETDTGSVLIDGNCGTQSRHNAAEDSDLKVPDAIVAMTENICWDNAQTKYLYCLLTSVSSVIKMFSDPMQLQPDVFYRCLYVEYLADVVGQLKSESWSSSEGGNAMISPLSLGDAGRFAHETLCLTAMALKVLNRVCLSRPAPGSSADVMDNWKRTKQIATSVAEEHRNAALAAIESVIELIEPVLVLSESSDETNPWAGFVGNFVSSPHVADLVPFLPYSLDVRTSDSDGRSDHVSRLEFQKIIIGRAYASQVESLRNILRTLRALTSTFKLTLV